MNGDDGSADWLKNAEPAHAACAELVPQIGGEAWVRPLRPAIALAGPRRSRPQRRAYRQGAKLRRTERRRTNACVQARRRSFMGLAPPSSQPRVINGCVYYSFAHAAERGLANRLPPPSKPPPQPPCDSTTAVLTASDLASLVESLRSALQLQMQMLETLGRSLPHASDAEAVTSTSSSSPGLEISGSRDQERSSHRADETLGRSLPRASNAELVASTSPSSPDLEISESRDQERSSHCADVLINALAPAESSSESLDELADLTMV